MRLPCPTRPILPQALLLISVGLLPGCFLFENCNADGDEDCSSLTRPTPTPNQPPTVTITAPAVSAHHSEGQQIAFGASVTDGEDDITVIGARPPSWSSDRDGPLGAGLSLSVSLSAGIHVVTVTYTDTGGLTASAGQQVNVMPASYAGVNHSPVTTITLPEPSPIYLPGTPIVFEGDAVDPEEGPLPDASLVWEIGSEGAPRTVIGTGRRPTISTPPAGCYAVYLSATDSYGGTGEASRFGREAMFVGPFAPCQVQPPSLTPSALRVHVGEPGTVAVALSGPGRFRAKVRLEDGVDAVEDVLADHSYRLLTAEDWLLTIEPAATLLPGSTHELEIAAYYPQADGAFECRIPLLIVIDDGESNQAPLVSILSPGDRWFYPGEIITFEATAVDPEDGPLAGPSLVWEDSNLGVIGTGESFQRSDLPNGGLSLVVTATDSQGDQGRAYATVRISANGAPLVTIVSPGAAQLFTLGETVTFAGSATDSHERRPERAIARLDEQHRRPDRGRPVLHPRRPVARHPRRDAHGHRLEGKVQFGDRPDHHHRAHNRHDRGRGLGRLGAGPTDSPPGRDRGGGRPCDSNRGLKRFRAILLLQHAARNVHRVHQRVPDLGHVPFHDDHRDRRARPRSDRGVPRA